MKERFFKNRHQPLSFDTCGVLLSEYLAEEAEEQKEQRMANALKLAGGVLGQGSLSMADERVAKFIDDLFSQDENLAKAWVVPAFPFLELNDIYKSITSNDHPIFVELFGSSFIAGTFLGGPEEPDGVINVSQSRIPYFYQGVAYNVPILESGQA